MKKKVWFITGASKGLGLVLVQKLLEQGYPVAATSRSWQDLVSAVRVPDDQFLPLSSDITSEESVAKAIKSAIDHFGRVDVVVNNAGYGLTGALEELSDLEARRNFDVNVFGSLNVIRQAMPGLRNQGSGHIFNVSSIGGFTGNFPGFGIYCATKFAVQGFSESLAAEAKQFGVKVTVVSPGYFRTNFLESSSLNTPADEMPEYANVRSVEALHREEINGNQPGDPAKAAAALIRVAEQSEPVMHLFLGEDAFSLAEAKMNDVHKDLESTRSFASHTNFEEVPA